MFGTVGWGAFSLVAGALVAAKGVHFGFLAYAATAAIALIPTLLLPLDVLKGAATAPVDDAAGFAGVEKKGEEKAASSLSSTKRTTRSSSKSRNVSGISATARNDSGEKTSNVSSSSTSATASTTTATNGGSFVDLLSNRKTSVFLGLALTLGFANGAIASFLPLYLSDLGGSETLLGAAIAVA